MLKNQRKKYHKNIYFLVISEKMAQNLISLKRNSEIKMIDFEFFFFYLLAPIIIVLGIFGNSCDILVLSKKTLLKIGPRDMYIYLFIFDSSFIFFMIENYLVFGFSINIEIISKQVCKLIYYFNYMLAAISPWLLSIILFFLFII